MHDGELAEQAVAFAVGAGGVEDVDEAVPMAGDVVVSVGVLVRVSDVDLAVEVLNAEGRIAGGDLGIVERAGERGGLEAGVEYVHAIVVEVGGRIQLQLP